MNENFNCMHYNVKFQKHIEPEQYIELHWYLCHVKLQLQIYVAVVL